MKCFSCKEKIIKNEQSYFYDKQIKKYIHGGCIWVPCLCGKNSRSLDMGQCRICQKESDEYMKKCDKERIFIE